MVLELEWTLIGGGKFSDIFGFKNYFRFLDFKIFWPLLGCPFSDIFLNDYFRFLDFKGVFFSLFFDFLKFQNWFWNQNGNFWGGAVF